MTDSVRRAIRTFFQAFIGVLLSSGILSAMATEGIVDWSTVKKVGLSALGAGIVALVSFIQNSLEDRDIIPALPPK